VRLLVTGGSGVLGRAFRPLAEADGHKVLAPSRADLDLFDPVAVGEAVQDVDAVLHLASRIQPLGKLGQPEAWTENDRLRAEASAILVDAALAADVETYALGTGRPETASSGGQITSTPLATCVTLDSCCRKSPRARVSWPGAHCWPIRPGPTLR
jgi:hypothetical protein